MTAPPLWFLAIFLAAGVAALAAIGVAGAYIVLKLLKLNKKTVENQETR